MALKQDRVLEVDISEATPISTESPSYSVNTPNTETEDAAQALEDIALGRRQYHSFGLNSEVPGSHTLSASVSMCIFVSAIPSLTWFHFSS
jgi:hypothetical protein